MSRKPLDLQMVAWIAERAGCSERDRRVLELRLHHRYLYRVIAQEVGIETANARQIVHRALDAVRDWWEQQPQAADEDAGDYDRPENTLLVAYRGRRPSQPRPPGPEHPVLDDIWYLMGGRKL